MNEHIVNAVMVKETDMTGGPAEARSSKSLVCTTLPSGDKVWALTITAADENAHFVRFSFVLSETDPGLTFFGMRGTVELYTSCSQPYASSVRDLDAQQHGPVVIVHSSDRTGEQHRLEMAPRARCVVTAVTDASAPNPFADQFCNED